MSHSEAFGHCWTGEAVQGQGECKVVRLYVQGLAIVEDLFPFPLGNSDVILGIQWSEKFCDIWTN